MRKNILVQYDGGGYDGCIWEWNYFYIDKAGTFHNISASGVGGINNLKAAIELIENGENSFSNRVFIYCLDNETEIRDFATKTACSHVLSVLQWFNVHNDPDAEPFAVCLECGCKIVDADDIQLTADVLLCSDCYGSGLCDVCNEYDKTTVFDQETEQAACEYCLEDIKDQATIADQQDLLFQSLATGKPDLFSEDMRWFFTGK